MNKYLKVGFAAIVLCGLVVGKIQATASTLTIDGTISAIHNVYFTDGGSSISLATSHTGAVMTDMGYLTINDNNPTGFAVRIYSQNYRDGFYDALANNAAVLKLTGSGNDPIASDVQTNAKPGTFVSYKLGFKMDDANTTLKGVATGNTTIAGSALSSAYNTSPYMRVSNSYVKTGDVLTSNEIRFTAPTQATVSQRLRLGVETSVLSPNQLFAGTYQDVLEVAIVDNTNDGAADDGTALYDGSGNSISW